MSQALIDRIVRFNLVTDDAGQLTHVGPSLTRLLPDAVGADLFELLDPEGTSFDLATPLPEIRGMVSIAFRHPDVTLRGEFIELADAQWLFAGCLDPIEAERIHELRLGPREFAQLDLSLDFSMLKWTRDMQVREARLTLLSLRSSIETQDALRDRLEADELTGLVSRNSLLELVNDAIVDRRRDSPALAVIVVDVDRFKSINDLHGHLVGDLVLRHLADHLNLAVADRGTVARLGGDEFAVLLEADSRRALGHLVAQVADEITTLNHDPISIGDLRLSIRVSLGVAHHHQQPTAGDLLRHADIALGAARENDDGPIAVFDPENQRADELRRSLAESLTSAIASRSIELVFQPIVELSTRRAVKFEVLSRWNHPIHGPIEPGLFFEVAESTNLIHDLDRYVIHRALHVARERLTENGHVPILSVNVSARSLTDDLVDYVQATLREMHYPANRLCVEVTETASVLDMERTERVLRRFDDLGIVVSLDDFGTGFSSLTYLHRLPIGALKIDRSFVADMLTSRKALELVRSILNVAESLSLPVVAEGIETVEQCILLQNLGCNQGQGYYFAKPAPAETAALTIGRTLPYTRSLFSDDAHTHVPSRALQLARDPSIA